MGLREEKEKARTALHLQMRVRALYYATGSALATPTVIYTRLHSKFDALGDAKGTNFHYSERNEVVPALLFMLAEIEPVRHAVVVLGLGEAYRLEADQPPDFITVTWNALALPEAEAVAFDYPGSTPWPIDMWS